MNKTFSLDPFVSPEKKLALSKVSKNIKIDNTKTDIISIFMMRFIKRGSQTDLDFICHRDMMMVSEHQPPFEGSIQSKFQIKTIMIWLESWLNLTLAQTHFAKDTLAHTFWPISV